MTTMHELLRETRGDDPSLFALEWETLCQTPHREKPISRISQAKGHRNMVMGKLMLGFTKAVEDVESVDGPVRVSELVAAIYFVMSKLLQGIISKSDVAPATASVMVRELLESVSAVVAAGVSRGRSSFETKVRAPKDKVDAAGIDERVQAYMLDVTQTLHDAGPDVSHGIGQPPANIFFIMRDRGE